SGDSFTPADDSVRFGLNAIKGIGSSSVGAMIEARNQARFTSLFDFVSRIDQGSIGRRGLESLITAGAFDSLKPVDTSPNLYRAKLFAGIDSALSYSHKAWNDRMCGQNALFGEELAGDAVSDGSLPDVQPWSQSEISRQEKAAIGFYLSVHPLDDYKEILSNLKILNIADHEEMQPGDTLTLAGIVSGMQAKYSKKGNKFCSFRLEDQSTGVKCLVWAKSFEKYCDFLKNDELLIVEGRVESAEGQEITFIVNDVKSLADAQPRNARSVTIALPNRENNEEYFYDLYTLLNRCQGRCEVLIELPAENLSVKMQSHALRIQGSRNLENELRSRGCAVKWVI
ncbi:MAG: OB-fold nucleic acid binding domain-containing protein, partial [Pyrinomonadaceae bacterium]